MQTSIAESVENLLASSESGWSSGSPRRRGCNAFAMPQKTAPNTAQAIARSRKLLVLELEGESFA
jgi:hypothetical protein